MLPNGTVIIGWADKEYDPIINRLVGETFESAEYFTLRDELNAKMVKCLVR